MGLVTELSRIQRQGNLTNGQMARSLGMSRDMWVGVRSGRRRFGRRSLQRILAAYPALAGLVLLHMQEPASKPSRSVEVVA